jgi:branched-chain amino acid transport system substrate-binding protein
MMPKLYTYLIVFILVSGLIAGCTQVPKKAVEPSETDQTTPALDEKPPEDDADDVHEPPIVDILLNEAESFADNGHYKDALFILNQAYSLSTPDRKEEILIPIEEALANIEPDEIIEFQSIENLSIPESYILYWLGVNLLVDNDLPEARQILETFIASFPDHKYFDDTVQMIEMIKKSLFKRESIGLLLPLSGKYMMFGQRALNGAQLAVAKFSFENNRPIKLIIKDTMADPDTTRKAVEELVQQGVSAIIGPLLNVTQAGQAAQENRIPLIAMTQKSDFPLQGDYLFSNFITPEMQVQTLGAYLFDELNIQKVAILYPEEKYGERYKELFWDVVDQFERDVVGIESYDGSKTDFTESIQKLTGEFYPVPEHLKEDVFDPYRMIDPKVIGLSPVKVHRYQKFESSGTRGQKEDKRIEIDFEALFIPDSPSKINLILPQLAFNDARGMILVGTNLWHDNHLLKGSKRYNRNAVISDGFFADSKNIKTAEFTKEFKAMYGENPKFLEAIAYDSTNLLLNMVADETIESKQDLIEQLKGQRVFDGVTGATVFDDQGRARRQLFLITVKNDKFVEINR